MNVRKTKIISFNVSSSTFINLEEAIKEANAIKIWLQRLCNSKSYSCKAIIGVSKNKPKTGEIKAVKTGFRGRPAYHFVRTSKIITPIETKPHIHIIFFANPADMICSLLAKHLNNKYKHNVVWYKNCTKYVKNAVNYVFMQCLKVRKVEVDNDNILVNDDFGFYAAVEKANQKQEKPRISFTYNNKLKTLSKADIKAIIQNIKGVKILQCNININKYTNNIYKLYYYLLLSSKHSRCYIYTIIYKVCIYFCHITIIPP